MPLLGGLAVFEAQARGDLLPGRSASPGLENEVVLVLVKVAAQGADGGKAGQGAAGGCRGADRCQ